MVGIDLMTIDNFTVVIIMRHKHVDHLNNCTCIQGLERFFTLMICKKVDRLRNRTNYSECKAFYTLATI